LLGKTLSWINPPWHDILILDDNDLLQAQSTKAGSPNLATEDAA
jgi:hypothetical protein